MNYFIDTSAFLAILDADDENHFEAKQQWEALIFEEHTLFCTSYILVESFALIQHRLGLRAVRTFHEDIVPLLIIEWVDESIHREGVTGMLAAGRKKLSLVDCVSFDVMRSLGIKSAFAFDRHFKEQGFTIIP
ncbi:MAG: type II toxin-antitoxin system VapC family toxin [bacterium]